MSSTPDALLIAVSKRISSIDHEVKLLMNFSSLSPFLEPTTREIVFNHINDIRNFRQSAKVSSIKTYLEGYLRKLPGSEHNFRLPKSSAPISYDLHLKSAIHTDEIVQFEYIVEGEVTIKLKVLEIAEKLILHSRSLEIEELKLFDASGLNEVDFLGFNLYAPTDLLTIYLAEDAKPETVLVLKAKFKFPMNLLSAKTGFYRNFYIEDGVRR